MINMKQAMLSAMADLPACTAESFCREEKELPLVVVGDAERTVLARVDGKPYLEQYQAQVDVYAATAPQADALAARADTALWNLGLTRESYQESHDAQAYAYQRTMRYRAVLMGEFIYQEA